MARDTVQVRPEEMETASAWARAHLAGDAPPFSLVYGGRRFPDVAGKWRATLSEKKVSRGRIERTTAWTDPATGLVVTCVAVMYGDFPAVEWTVYLENGGKADTPIIEDIKALDIAFERATVGEFLLHHWVGSIASAGDFEPRVTKMEPPPLRLATRGGYSSDLTLPYFNLAWDDCGVMIAVGWPGQWAAEFAREGRTKTLVWAGLEGMRFRLKPGEKVRGPLIALVFYEGGFVRAQNVWRRWMIAHNVPRVDGRLPQPFMPAGSSGQFSEMEKANEANQIQFIDRYLEERIPIDLWWMDAGWYVTPDVWWKTGTWEVDKRRFPNGLKKIIDYAHSKGLKALMWFEPERVHEGTELWEKHPEWLLSWDKRPESRVLNLGIPEALAWIVDRLDSILKSEGSDVYRQDFNVFPLAYWRGADEPEREGLTEIKHVEGYLALWDELRRRNPRLLYDTCASGGRRVDLETLRRSVPLHTTDHDYGDWEARQAQYYGRVSWIPFSGAGVCRGDVVDKYAFRSGYASMTAIGYDVRRKDLDYTLMRRMAQEWRRVSAYYYGDFYPLTPYSADRMSWLAWQFDDPGKDEGLVQAFRRSECPFVEAWLRLHALDVDARYVIENLDGGTTEATGRALREEGLKVALPERGSAAVFLYRRKG